MEWNLNFELGSKVFEIEKNMPKLESQGLHQRCAIFTFF
jgi:hypothetical protein